MAESVTESTSTESGNVQVNSPTSGDSKNAIPGVKMSDPANTLVDSGMRSRHARLQNIMSQLNEGDDEAEVEQRREALGVKKTEAKEPEETKALEKPDAEKEEERRETRRAEVEKKETGSVADEKAEAAPEAEAEEPKVEEPKEDATKLEKERKAKFDKVLKMEAQAQKKEEKLREREAQVIRDRQWLDGRAKELESFYQKQLRDHQGNIDTASRILKLARENPLELLERAGVGPEDVAKWVTQAADPTAQLKREYDRRFEELDRKEKEQRAADQRRQEEAQRNELRKQVETEYLGHFEEKADDGEYLLEPARLIYSRDEALRLGNQIANEASRMGHTFTARDIAEAVNELAKDDERYKTIQKRLSKVAETQKPSTATESKAPALKAAAPIVPKQTTVLNNRMTQDTVPAPAKKSNGENPNYKRDRELRLKKIQAGLE